MYMHMLVAGTEELVRLLSISFIICRGNSSIERLVAQRKIENRNSCSEYSFDDVSSGEPSIKKLSRNRILR